MEARCEQVLNAHGATWSRRDGALWVEDVYTQDGDTFAEWLELPWSVVAVKAWLGY